MNFINGMKNSEKTAIGICFDVYKTYDGEDFIELFNELPGFKTEQSIIKKQKIEQYQKIDEESERNWFF